MRSIDPGFSVTLRSVALALLLIAASSGCVLASGLVVSSLRQLSALLPLQSTPVESGLTVTAGFRG